jgi:hypothetical protein
MRSEYFSTSCANVFAGLQALLQICDGQFIEFEVRWWAVAGVVWLKRRDRVGDRDDTSGGGCLQKLSTFHVEAVSLDRI